MTVLLAHGWGFDARIWDAVRARLDPALSVETIDFGYFGAAKLGAGRTATLAVGHSFGALWWLAQQDIPWRRLLCINGFARFTAEGDYPGVAPRLLERMRRQFANDPATVLADFHARCGGSVPAAHCDPARLATGLAQLAELDERATLARRRDDVWALAGGDDPIVPRAMSETAFAVLPAGQLAFADSPGHLLPLSHPALCAQWIARLSAGLAP